MNPCGTSRPASKPTRPAAAAHTRELRTGGSRVASARPAARPGSRQAWVVLAGCSAVGRRRLLFLLLLLSALPTAAPAGSRGCAHSARFLDSTVSTALGPWAASGRRFSSTDVVASLTKLRGSECCLAVTVHGGAVYLLHPPHYSLRPLASLRVLRGLQDAAAAFPEMAFEAVLNLLDDPLDYPPFGEDGQLPHLSLNRDRYTGDVLVPHHHVAPEQLCPAHQRWTPKTSVDASLTARPWAERQRRIVGRFSHFCGARDVRIFGGAVEECPRTYFSHLAQSHGSVAGFDNLPIELDIAPTNKVGETPLDVGREFRTPTGGLVEARRRIPLDRFAEARYVLVTDGTVNAGKLANALALGSVVFLPASQWQQYFEPALQPWVHFIPVWTDALDDLLPKLSWADRDPGMAERIADAGQRFSSMHLSMRGRHCYWRALAKQYAELLFDYSVTEETVRERQAQFPEMRRLGPDTVNCTMALGVPKAGMCQFEGQPGEGWEMDSGDRGPWDDDG